MSTLYLGTDQIALAERLASLLDDEARTGDMFRPVTIVVPNRYLGKWLRLWLARTRGIAINLRFLYLEQALWELLREQDPRPHDRPLELIDQEGYRLMVLSVLLEENGPHELEPLRQYIQGDGPAGRDTERRAWQLADRLARLIRDYEYHRQDALIQKWLRRELGYPAADAVAHIEKSQREVFHQIIKLPDGKREKLCAATNKLHKTLPQYAMEMMELAPPVKAGPRPTIHLFGTTQISTLHLRALRWLGERYDLRLYHLSPLVGLLPSSLTQESLRELSGRFEQTTVNELLRPWGRAGLESLCPLAALIGDPFCVELLPPLSSKVSVSGLRVLSRLQDHLLNRSPPAAPRVPQDTSLQMVACPGVEREVETVYNSILYNLQHTPDLKQTDVAVLVTDMPRYRPVLQAVFEREPRRLHYNLADLSAAGASAFGRALVGLLDLALESFTRSRVFEVLLNPCVLARLRVDRSRATTWLAWAEALGIYHSWDAQDKKERGYGSSPLFGWQLALRRLRLGRLMDAAPLDEDGPAPNFQGVLPYADLAAGDKEELDAFCRAVEGLLPALGRLRKQHATGSAWAGTLQQLVQNFLAVPADRPEEAQVRDRIAGVIDQLRTLDKLSRVPPALTLALVREIVQDSLEAIEGAKGEYLTGGVTISALQPLRPVPFRILYVLGLGEDVFPGSNRLPSYDLRSVQRSAGDIRPAEQNRYLFLEALLAARDKIYLLYPCHELQRDQELHPCVPLTQLRRFLEQQVIDGEFKTARVPLSGLDRCYVSPQNTAITDVLVNYNDTERLLGLAQAREFGEVQVNAGLAPRLEGWLAESRKDFAVEAATGNVAAVPTISLRELARFLRCPADAALRRHLHLVEDDAIDPEDDEPFLTTALRAACLIRQSLSGFIARATKNGVAQALEEWPRRFDELFEEGRLRCQAPDGAFGEIDHQALARELANRIGGDAGLADFLQRHQSIPLVGPLLIGESFAPINARERFPALRIPFSDGGATLFQPAEARLVGTLPLAWRSDDALETLVVSGGGKEISPSELCRFMLEPWLFYVALRAGAEALPGGVSGRDWLGNRRFLLHVAHTGGIATYTYTAGAISPTEAERYLRALAEDLLDRASFDLLPFELIVKDRELAKAFSVRDGEAAGSAEAYAERLDELVAQDRDSEHPAFWYSELLELADPRVPADALEKVQRRLTLLARGLAPKQPKPKRKARDRDSAGSRPRPARRPGGVGRNG